MTEVTMKASVVIYLAVWFNFRPLSIKNNEFKNWTKNERYGWSLILHQNYILKFMQLEACHNSYNSQRVKTLLNNDCILI